jgi:DnaK suppressor protein
LLLSVNGTEIAQIDHSQLRIDLSGFARQRGWHRLLPETRMIRAALSKADRLMFRQQLQDLVARVSGNVTQLEAEVLRPTGLEGAAAVSPGHESVPTSTESDEEVARSLLLTEEQILSESRAALCRLEAGTFGICESCGRAISRQRLEAVPYARLCIACARSASPNPTS